MNFKPSYATWIGFGLIAASLALFGLSFLPGWAERSGPAIIFLSLTAVSVFFLASAPREWDWRGWAYIPAATFFAFGLVFLFNVLTGDWTAWAYAWLFCLSGLGVGIAMAARSTIKHRLLFNIGAWGASGSAVLFGIFGAISSGPFMRAFAILLLAVTGLLVIAATTQRLRWSDLTWPSEIAPPLKPGTLDASANQALPEPLSKRELEVLVWIDQGLSNAEIAERMVVAQSTVKTHINNIYSKLGVLTRTQALRKAKDLGLL